MALDLENFAYSDTDNDTTLEAKILEAGIYCNTSHIYTL